MITWLLHIITLIIVTHYYISYDYYTPLQTYYYCEIIISNYYSLIFISTLLPWLCHYYVIIT